MLLRQLSYAIKNQLKAPKAPTRSISCLSLVLYGIRIGGRRFSTNIFYHLSPAGGENQPADSPALTPPSYDHHLDRVISCDLLTQYWTTPDLRSPPGVSAHHTAGLTHTPPPSPLPHLPPPNPGPARVEELHRVEGLPALVPPAQGHQVAAHPHQGPGLSEAQLALAAPLGPAEVVAVAAPGHEPVIRLSPCLSLCHKEPAKGKKCP